MADIVRNVDWSRTERSTDDALELEWLVTNGLGGYASGTVAGVITRRFHGLLIAALPSPYGRRMMFNDLAETIRFPDGRAIELGGEEKAHVEPSMRGAKHLREFRLEGGAPVWIYEFHGVRLEKVIAMPHRQNTVHVRYRLLDPGEKLRLELRPALHFRPHEGALGTPLDEPYVSNAIDDRFEFSSANQRNLPPLRMKLYADKSAFTFEKRYLQEMRYRIEEARGYEAQGDLWSPGYFRCELSESPATLIASTDSWDTVLAMHPADALAIEQERTNRLLSIAHPDAQTGMASELVLAADQFIMTPVGRVEDMARARATGDEIRSVIAGYHWFTDWGRDTMISLEGLTLTTGRHIEAGWILRTFAYYVRDGLIPNMFPEGEKQGLYHTADATLWFFHAMARYLAYTNDRTTLCRILPKLQDIVACHIKGTHFGIQVDPADGLLHQGAEGYQLTWMDAKVDGWVVTPRRGKAVEINALWYNALRLLEDWLRQEGMTADADELAGHSRRCYESFNQRFWNADRNYLFDVVDCEGGGNDPQLRPNQLFSFSLEYPVLNEPHWKPVLDVCQEKLVTPVGLRSLGPDERDYKGYYSGNLRERDAAYHQGTVWGWLIGPFVDAYLRVYPNDKAGARRFLEGFEPHLSDACIGSISEVFDASPPFKPRACIAQAWSVAEVLRCWVKTAS